MEDEAQHLEAGTIIADRYRIESVLGEGGMGVVYLAEHVHMRKRVALKVLLNAWSQVPEVIARFEREAIAAGKIDHPNVAAATDFGRLPDGSFFLVLEHIAGQPLRHALNKGPIDPERAARILRGATQAVGAAHARGVIHRDLKPENIMLVERAGDPDFVKVLDFGIAKIDFDDAQALPGQALTRKGAVLGTPDYMAPEQAMGKPVDVRADLYALGVVFFEMLTGTCPFQGGAITVLRQHVMDAPPPIPTEIAAKIDPQLQAIVLRLMQKEPADRYATAADLLAALDEARETSSHSRRDRAVARAKTAPLSTPPAPVPRFTRGRLLIAGAAIIGVALLLIASIRLSGASAPAQPTTVATESVPEVIDVPTPSPLPPPSSPGANAAAAVTPGASAASPAPTAARATKPTPPRRTGPGGIYVPPPRKWFQ